MTQPERQLYTTAEIALLFRVDHKTVRRWTAAGVLPTLRLPRGNRLRISLEGIDVPTGPLLKVAEVASLFSIHPSTAGRWAREGVLPTFRLPNGGRFRFYEEPVRQRLAHLDL